MLNCKIHILQSQYPQIWSWGIVWKCEICGDYFMCECFKKHINKLLFRLKKEQERHHKNSGAFSIFAHNFPAEYINYLFGFNIAKMTYHLNQPIFVFLYEVKEINTQMFDFFSKLKEIKYLKQICHLCKKSMSDHYFCGDIYGSKFKQRYGAYIYRQLSSYGLTGVYKDEELIPLRIKKKYFNNISIPEFGHTDEFGKAMRNLEKSLENNIRKKLNYPLIGEYWVQETILYKTIKEIFPKYNVKHHYFAEWLGGQELDIFIEELNIGIEYQGKQHFEAIDFFGGEIGLKATKERDKRKLQICKRRNVKIIYFRYDEKLKKELIRLRLIESINFQLK